MKTIINLFKECGNSAEVLAWTVVLIIGAVAWVMPFASVHWLCGVMALGYYPAVLGASIRVARALEKYNRMDEEGK